jgi:GAF domain-containing protein
MSTANTALEIQHAVLTALLQHSSVGRAAPRFLAEIGPVLGVDVGMLWLLDRRSAVRSLYCAAAWARDPEAMESFLTASRVRRFRIGDGPQAAVWEEARPLFLTSSNPALALPRHADIAAVGLRNAFAFPIEGDDRVLGVMEGFRTGEEPTADALVRAAESLGPLLGLALLREETERARVETAAHLAALIQNLGSGALFEHEDRRIALVNQAMCDLFRLPLTPAALVGTDGKVVAEQVKERFSDPDDFVRRTDRALAGRERVLGEPMVLVTGTVVERDYIPVFVGGTYVGHLWTFREIANHPAA